MPLCHVSRVFSHTVAARDQHHQRPAVILCAFTDATQVGKLSVRKFYLLISTYPAKLIAGDCVESTDYRKPKITHEARFQIFVKRTIALQSARVIEVPIVPKLVHHDLSVNCAPAVNGEFARRLTLAIIFCWIESRIDNEIICVIRATLVSSLLRTLTPLWSPLDPIRHLFKLIPSGRIGSCLDFKEIDVFLVEHLVAPCCYRERIFQAIWLTAKNLIPNKVEAPGRFVPFVSDVSHKDDHSIGQAVWRDIRHRGSSNGNHIVAFFVAQLL